MALVERIEKTTDATGWEGQIPLNYRYTAGRAGQRFFTQIRDKGNLLGARCDDCGVTYVPPAIFCEKCFARLEDSFVELPAKGTVHAVTVCHETYDGTRKDEPSLVAMIRIDGTESGLLHWLGGVDAADVEIGMRVEAVFKPKGERKGSVLDIKHFKPAK
jgi:uncharacterized OB-fold protein